LLSLQSHRANYPGEKLPGRANKRFACRLFFRAGCLATEKEVGIRGANSENKLLPGMEVGFAGGVGKDSLTQPVEAGDFVSGGKFEGRRRREKRCRRGSGDGSCGAGACAGD
jgi:hypothetical protein